MPGFSKVTLKPENYSLHVLERLDSLRKDRTLCDCTLKVDGQEFPVHKCFLSACSPYFKALFTSQLRERASSTIEIGGLSSTTFRVVLDFMYQGEIHLTNENITDIYPASEFLQISELRHTCCDYFLNQLCSSNCLGMWHYARSYSNTSLEAVAWRYITKNFTEVVTSGDEFQSLSKDEFCTILAANDLEIDSELDTHDAVLTWLFHDLEERKGDLSEVFSNASLPLLGTQLSSSLAKNSHVFSIGQSSKDLMVQVRNAQSLGSTNPRQPTIPVFKTPPRKSSKQLVVVGGYCSGFVTCCETLDSKSGLWDDMELSLPSSKELYWVGVIGMRMYALAGNSVTNINEVLSKFTPSAADLLCSGALATDWELEAKLPFDASGSQICTLNECIYILGEVLLDGITVYGISRYDPSSGTWEFLSPLRESRVSAGFVAHGGKLYLAGGLNPHSGAILPTLEAFDPTTGYWDPLPSCATGRYHAGAAILNSSLYLIGGISDSVGDRDVLTDSVECFSFTEKKWSTAGRLSAPRAGIAACVWKGKVYAIGGECQGRNHSDLVNSYDCESDEWTVLPPLKNERIYPNIFVL